VELYLLSRDMYSLLFKYSVTKDFNFLMILFRQIVGMMDRYDLLRAKACIEEALVKTYEEERPDGFDDQ
jgi:hypothetical protein